LSIYIQAAAQVISQAGRNSATPWITISIPIWMKRRMIIGVRLGVVWAFEIWALMVTSGKKDQRALWLAKLQAVQPAFPHVEHTDFLHRGGNQINRRRDDGAMALKTALEAGDHPLVSAGALFGFIGDQDARSRTRRPDHLFNRRPLVVEEIDAADVENPRERAVGKGQPFGAAEKQIDRPSPAPQIRLAAPKLAQRDIKPVDRPNIGAIHQVG